MGPFQAAQKEHIFKGLKLKSSQALLMLDVSDIYILKTIAEFGSTNKAAEKLHMSQPTLSKRVSRLEQVLNVELFHRSNAGMKPTRITEYLIENGQNLQSQLDSLCRHVELLANLEGGSLKIGVSPVIEQLLFPKVLLDFIEETQNVEISFRVDSPEALVKATLSGEVDVAIGPYASDELPLDLAISEVDTASVIFVVRPGHPLLPQDNPVTVQELTSLNGIGPALNQAMIKAMEAKGLSATLKITCDSYHIAKNVVMNSDYYTGGPAQLFEKELNSGELIAVNIDTDIRWQACCITRPESVHIPTVKKFLDILSQYSE